MKRILILIFVLYVCGAAGRAQDLKTLFVALPDSLSPLLTEVNRADFGDFLESGMKAEVKNRFGNMSEMTKLTSDYLFLKTTSASTLELKLLPLNDSVKVICAVSPIRLRLLTVRLLFMIRTGMNCRFPIFYSFRKKMNFI